jgi:hypothetical protein
MIEEYDELIIRCPQLGGEVPFKYCRAVNENLPCKRIIICWEFRIDIGRFLEENYLMEQIQSALSPKEKSRIETILEIIEKAKKLKAKDPDC